MTCHNLKIWPEYFELVSQGKKTFEARKVARKEKDIVTDLRIRVIKRTEEVVYE